MKTLRIRKRPTETTAVIYDGDNAEPLIQWVRSEGGEAYEAEGHLYINTDRGDAIVDIGDTVIRGLVGEFYPCTPAAFEVGWEILE